MIYQLLIAYYCMCIIILLFHVFKVLIIIKKLLIVGANTVCCIGNTILTVSGKVKYYIHCAINKFKRAKRQPVRRLFNISENFDRIEFENKVYFRLDNIEDIKDIDTNNIKAGNIKTNDTVKIDINKLNNITVNNIKTDNNKTKTKDIISNSTQGSNCSGSNNVVEDKPFRIPIIEDYR